MTLPQSPAGFEEAQFKRVPEGWLFATLPPWGIGPRRTYLISDAQKPTFAARVRVGRLRRLLLLLPIMTLTFVAFIMDPGMLNSSRGLIEVGALLVLFGIAIGLSDYLAVRPLLRGCPRTSQRIGYLDMMRITSAMSLTRLVTLAAIFTVCAIGFGFQAFTSSRATWVEPLLAISNAAFAASYVGALVLKLFARRAN